MISSRHALRFLLTLAWVSFAQLAWAESQAWIGLVMYDVSRGNASDPAGGEIFVMIVYEDSPASSAGMRAGDVILELDGRVLANSQELICAIASHVPGDVVRLTLIRSGVRFVASIALINRPAGVYASPRNCEKNLSTRTTQMKLAVREQ